MLTGLTVYVKLFQSIYQGILRGNSNGLLVFTNLLAHADQYGIVDVHPKAIAEEVGLTIEQVKAAIQELESPDIESRSPESEGRRIVLLDGHRAWGWQIVNYVKYRTIKNEDDRREQNREAQARWRNKHKQSSSEVINVDADKPMQKQKHIQKKENTERTARGTRLPDDLNFDFQFAIQNGIQDPAEEANKFRDYWHAQPGSKGVKLDWPATWRNWCRNAKSSRGNQSETAYQRSQREKYEQIAPAVAARGPNNPNTFFDIVSKPLEITNA